MGIYKEKDAFKTEDMMNCSVEGIKKESNDVRPNVRK